MSEKIDTLELISQIRLRGIRPSQIFTRDEFEKDPDFSKVIKAEVDYQLWLKDQETNKKEEKLKEENELIPGYEEEKKGKKKEEENELIPDSDNDLKNENGNELIPE